VHTYSCLFLEMGISNVYRSRTVFLLDVVLLMLTIREAKQRLSMHRMELRRHIGNLWLIAYAEDRHDVAEKNGYITSDLEDAIIQGSQMRMRRLRAI
jgi:hypothetical protein